MSKSEIYEIVVRCGYATLAANAFRRAFGIDEVWVADQAPRDNQRGRIRRDHGMLREP